MVYLCFHLDELEDRFKDVNATAFILRKGVIDNLLEYTCNRENQTGCNKTNAQGVDNRARAINLNDEGGLDLVFVIDASSSVKRDGFKLGLNFSQELVRTIDISKRYGNFHYLMQQTAISKKNSRLLTNRFSEKIAYSVEVRYI